LGRAHVKRCYGSRGIEQRDGAGRVVHFHAFRKTFQTLGMRAGVNQRSAQALLGHSDPALTANVYTAVASLELHREVAKLPWIDAQVRIQKVSVVVRKGTFSEKLSELIEACKALVGTEKLAFAGESSWLPGMDSNHD